MNATYGFLLPAIVLALIVTALVCSLVIRRREIRDTRRLADMPCPFCASVFGSPAAKTALDIYREKRIRYGKDFSDTLLPKVEIALVLSRLCWDVVCPSCERPSSFDREKLELIDPHETHR